MDTAESVRARLIELGDPLYKKFQSALIPTVDSDKIIGVRVPELRRLAKSMADTPQAAEFTAAVPHMYYDEDNLHGLILGYGGDYGEVVAGLNGFLPYVDNWATCDIIRPAVFKKHLGELMGEIVRWIDSGEVYTVRFGVEMLMCFYLDGLFRPEYLELAASADGREPRDYYIDMMIAWYFATALAKQYDAAVTWLEQRRLSGWTHNRAIRKAVESRRISDGRKAYLRTLRV